MRALPRLGRRTTILTPFGAGVLFALAVALLPPGPTSAAPLVLAAVGTVGLGAAAIWLPWARIPAWLAAAPPLLYFVVIAALREAQGGSASGYDSLCVLPVFWLALHGTRRELGLAVGCVGVVFVAPLVLVGGNDYPASEWRHAILWTAICGFVGYSVHSLVARARARGALARERAAQLELAQNQLSDAMNESPMGMARLTLDGTFVEVNPAVCRFLGRPADELLGHRASEFAHPDDRARTTAALSLLAAGAISFHEEEKRYVRPDGEAVWALLTISLVRDGTGAPVHHLSYIGDITAQKRAEQALRESEADLRAIATVARALSSSEDVRARICEAVVAVTDATAAFILEPQGDELVVTSHTGIETPAIRLRLRGERSGAVAAFLSGRQIFVDDAENDSRVSGRIVRALHAQSVLCQPVVSSGVSVGVIVVMWRRRLRELASRPIAAVALLADEAAVALERAALLAKLADQARLDELTALPNRRGWEERLPAELERSRRESAPCTVAMLDLDHFKLYNDTHGHRAGDELLRATARAWEDELRPSDFLARYGGEEFALVLPGCDPAGAERALKRIAARTPGGETCSIGVAVWDGVEDTDSLVERADRALYDAKGTGRNRIQTAPYPPGPALAAVGA